MRALSKLIYVNSSDVVLFVGEALVGNDAVDQLSKFNQKLADLSPSPIPRLIDGILLTKFDTIDDKMVPRGRMYRGPARNIADANMAAGVGSGMLPVSYGMAGVGGMLPLDPAASIPQPMPVTYAYMSKDPAGLAQTNKGWVGHSQGSPSFWKQPDSSDFVSLSSILFQVIVWVFFDQFAFRFQTQAISFQLTLIVESSRSIVVKGG
ncbi:uncharacterized protein LOC110937385 isoform X1 [Helianthus annuus]|uniref:uncharacterized protein LOC110937385 isoform X1 n=1 Tax=Helianthus annuus TaxID=4232 RepID=UPI0016532C84|nr:uncharacterized protein LOC110937385 isoform X1 [Helianthus annuus]